MSKTDPKNKLHPSDNMRNQITQKSNTPVSKIPTAECINPFIESVSNLFTTMLGCEVTREELSVRMNLQPNLDIVALIGLSGSIHGTVAMAFPIKTALSMVSRIYEKEMVVIDATVIDAVGEFVNIVAGGAQAMLSKGKKMSIDLGVPTVIRGTNFNVEYPSQATWLEIPFSSELGIFLIRVTIRQDSM